MTVQDLRDRGLILFEAVGGSIAYGTNTPASDIDIRGVFILPEDSVLGIGYIEQVANETNDILFYEVRRFLELVATNNPNILELLASPEDCIKFKHPLFDEIIKEKDKFITQKCKMSFGGYAVEQIKKARGLNKKIVNEMDKERKTPIDFCYVIDSTGYGTMPLTKWLKDNNYKQEYCGLTKIPNIRDGFALFYSEPFNSRNGDLIHLYKFDGIIKSNLSNELSLSSIPKEKAEKKPECILAFNKDGYSKYCKDYREYWEWVEKRNPERYKNVLEHGKNYDGKNLLHCHRLLDMAIEIGQEKGIIVRRPNREQLLAIRKGEYEYDALVSEAEGKIKIMDEAFAKSGLPEEVDMNFVDKLLIRIRREFYANQAK